MRFIPSPTVKRVEGRHTGVPQGILGYTGRHIARVPYYQGIQGGIYPGYTTVIHTVGRHIPGFNTCYTR